VILCADIVLHDLRCAWRTLKRSPGLTDEQHAPPNLFAFVRTRVAPEALGGPVRRAIYAMDPGLPVPALWSLTERFARESAFERGTTAAFFAFALVALVVASLGVHAAVSNGVSQRTRDIGIRIAVGATASDVLALVVGRAAVPIAAGIAGGLAISAGANRLLASQLVGVSPADPLALAAACAVFAVAAAVSCWLPARRATRIDPAVALRHE
jgi:hypothetical protein